MAKNGWSEKQIRFLEKNCGKMTIRMLSEKVGKSRTATRCKLINLGLGGGFIGNTELLRLCDVSEMIGVHTTYWWSSWRRNGFETKKIGGFACISFNDLAKFMREHPSLWDWRKCDEYYFRNEAWFQEIKNSGNNKRNYKSWTTLETKKALQMYYGGKTVREIANWLGRSYESVGHKICRETGILSGSKK